MRRARLRRAWASAVVLGLWSAGGCSRVRVSPGPVVTEEGEFATCPAGTTFVKGRSAQGTTLQWCRKPDGTPHGPWSSYYENGQRWLSGQFVNARKQGNWRSWYNNGRRKAEGPFRDGLPHGRWISWFDSGQKKADGHFDTGKMHGASVLWWPNGKIKERGAYRHGKRHGPWTLWRKGGS